MQSKYLNPSDVAKIFKITLNNLYVKLHRGIFPQETYFKLGRRIYFNEIKLTSWIEQGAKKQQLLAVSKQADN